MKKDKIFLSYRRDDSPGYVSRLEDELERTFGEGRVFRDATDIPGGKKWKNVIEESLRSSAVLILIIGPRWEQIWEARKNDKVNYVALELERARELGVPIMPVTLDGVQLSKNLDLGAINFIYENQFHDISDRQGRWGGDFARLVRLLEGIDGVGAVRNVEKGSRSAEEAQSNPAFKWVGVGAVLLLAAGVWAAMGPAANDVEVPPVVFQPTPETIVVEKNNAATATNVNAGSQQRPSVVPSAPPAVAPAAALVPDISGTWQGRDGTKYFVQQNADGTFIVESPGYASGRGRFFNNMPGKFEIQMFGIGRGEFSVSASGDRALGWIEVEGQQEFDTLVRID